MAFLFELSNKQGIPVTVSVHTLSIVHVKGNPSSWDSPEDFYGYTDIEFEVLDKDGREMKEMYDCISEKELERIEELCIKEAMSDAERDDYYMEGA